MLSEWLENYNSILHELFGKLNSQNWRSALLSLGNCHYVPTKQPLFLVYPVQWRSLRRLWRDTGILFYLVNDVIKARIIDDFFPVTDELESGLLHQMTPNLKKILSKQFIKKIKMKKMKKTISSNDWNRFRQTKITPIKKEKGSYQYKNSQQHTKIVDYM